MKQNNLGFHRFRGGGVVKWLQRIFESHGSVVKNEGTVRHATINVCKDAGVKFQDDLEHNALFSYPPNRAKLMAIVNRRPRKE